MSIPTSSSPLQGGTPLQSTPASNNQESLQKSLTKHEDSATSTVGQETLHVGDGHPSEMQEHVSLNEFPFFQGDDYSFDEGEVKEMASQCHDSTKMADRTETPKEKLEALKKDNSKLEAYISKLEKFTTSSEDSPMINSLKGNLEKNQKEIESIKKEIEKGAPDEDEEDFTEYLEDINKKTSEAAKPKQEKSEELKTNKEERAADLKTKIEELKAKKEEKTAELKTKEDRSSELKTKIEEMKAKKEIIQEKKNALEDLQNKKVMQDYAQAVAKSEAESSPATSQEIKDLTNQGLSISSKFLQINESLLKAAANQSEISHDLFEEIGNLHKEVSTFINKVSESQEKITSPADEKNLKDILVTISETQRQVSSVINLITNRLETIPPNTAPVRKDSKPLPDPSLYKTTKKIMDDYKENQTKLEQEQDAAPPQRPTQPLPSASPEKAKLENEAIVKKKTWDQKLSAGINKRDVQMRAAIDNSKTAFDNRGEIKEAKKELEGLKEKYDSDKIVFEANEKKQETMKELNLITKLNRLGEILKKEMKFEELKGKSKQDDKIFVLLEKVNRDVANDRPVNQDELNNVRGFLENRLKSNENDKYLMELSSYYKELRGIAEPQA